MAFGPAALAGLPAGYEIDQPLLVIANAARNSQVVDYAVGDVDGDGLADLVVAVANADPDGPTGPNPGTGAIRVLRQRPGGFEFGADTDLACVPGRPLLMDFYPDAGKEVVFTCATDSYSERRRQLIVFDMDAAGNATVSARGEDSNLGITPVTVVDVDQDGREDLFYTFPDDDNTTLDVEYRAAILYNHEQGFEVWQGRRFIYTGISWESGVQAIHPQAERIDLDGDGTLDALEGYCPKLCAFLQQPGRQLAMTSTTLLGQEFVAPSYGDLDGDGLPDRIQADWSTQSAWIQLQVAPLTFDDVGRIWPLSLPGPALIRDIDLNGLADVALASERDLVVFLQQEPGSFVYAGQGLLNLLDTEPLVAEDLTGDLCPDMVSLTSGGDGDYFFQLFRGLRCQQPGDLAVGVSWDSFGADVLLRQAGGNRVYEGVVVRVNISAALKDDRSIGLQLSAPVGCQAVPAEAPRHVFDCVVPQIGVGQALHLRFGVRPTKYLLDPIPMQAIAFLRDGSGDARESNNRGFASVQMSNRVTRSKTIRNRSRLDRQP